MIDKTAAAPREGWFTSSFSNGSQTCVEVKFDTGTVLVRDTKHRRPTLAMPPAAWTSFVNTVTV
jgi:hypothetical protein